MTTTTLLSALFKKVAHEPIVYLVVTDGDMPFVEPPYIYDIDEMTSEDEPEKEEATLSVFLTYEAAEAFRELATNMYLARPSQLKVIKLTLKDVWSLLEEQTEIVRKEFDSALKIVLVHTTDSGDYITSDVIYSQESLYN